MALDLREDPLAQATVPHDNLASHLYITCYLTSTNFAQSLMPQQEVVITALAKTAFKEQTPKLLVNLIHKI